MKMLCTEHYERKIAHSVLGMINIIDVMLSNFFYENSLSNSFSVNPNLCNNICLLSSNSSFFRSHSYVRNFANTYIFCCCIPLFSNLYLYIFLDNHDVNRVASMLKVKEILKNVYILLFCMPGIPLVYYGSEWVIEGERRGGLTGYAAE